MQLKLTGNVSGNSPHAAAVEMPFQIRRRARGQGVLRLLKNFASRSSYSAQDDSLLGVD